MAEEEQALMPVLRPINARPHQTAAVRAVLAGFRGHARVQVHMACGSGKTLVGQLVARRLRAQATIVFVPSILLVRQTVDLYVRQRSGAVIAVCSDSSSVNDDASVVQAGIACSVTTSVTAVRAFMRSHRRCTVVCTYQSAAILAGVRFDLAVFDEAHRTAGQVGKPFAYALTNKHVMCVRRLFMTATPRHAVLGRGGQERTVHSMSDEAVYGPVVHTLSLRAAIQRRLVCDYKVVACVVRGVASDTKTIARVAIRKALDQYGLRKVFTFHATVDRAQAFVSGSALSLRAVQTLHINGAMPGRVRAKILGSFQAADRALMSNARCLGEGVDVPQVDMVVFADPKRSLIDIVQALGRAIRPAAGKRFGYVLLPVFVPRSGSISHALAQADFGPCYETLRALRAQDAVLSAALNDWRDSGTQPSNLDVIVAGLDEADPDNQHTITELRKRVTTRVILSTYAYEDKWNAVLSLARAGAAQPKRSGSAYEKALSEHINALKTVRPDRYAQLRLIAPGWLKRSAESRDRRIANLAARAEAGLPRPSQRVKDEVLAYHTLMRVTNSRHPWFKRALLARLQRTAPHWFGTFSMQARAAEKKRQLLALAAHAAPLPKEVQLRTAAIRYTNPSDPSYDRVFEAQLLTLAPTWFPHKANKRANTKKAA